MIKARIIAVAGNVAHLTLTGTQCGQETGALFVGLAQPCRIVRHRNGTNDTVHGTGPEIHATHSDRSE